MRMKLVFLWFSAIVVMTFMGWHQSGPSHQSSTLKSETWDISEISEVFKSKDHAGAALTAHQSDIFFDNAVSKKKKEIEKSVQGQTITTEFPEIGGVSIIDGKPHVLLYSTDKNASYYTIDDAIDENWTIKSLNLKHIVAFNLSDDKEYTFPVTGSHLVSQDD